MRYTSRTMKRSNRILVAWLAVLAMVFAQLGGSAYACPIVDAASAAAMAGPHCDRMDDAQPTLCEKHCHDSQQAGTQLAVPPAFVPSFVATVVQVAPATGHVGASRPELRHAVHPPPTIRHCCWRI